jgi:hypothetical protein
LALNTSRLSSPYHSCYQSSIPLRRDDTLVQMVQLMKHPELVAVLVLEPALVPAVVQLAVMQVPVGCAGQWSDL